MIVNQILSAALGLVAPFYFSCSVEICKNIFSTLIDLVISQELSYIQFI